MNKDVEITVLRFLSHVHRHLVKSQPAKLQDVSRADRMAEDIVLNCKQIIYAENHLRAIKNGDYDYNFCTHEEGNPE